MVFGVVLFTLDVPGLRRLGLSRSVFGTVVIYTVPVITTWKQMDILISNLSLFNYYVFFLSFFLSTKPSLISTEVARVWMRRGGVISRGDIRVNGSWGMSSEK